MWISLSLRILSLVAICLQAALLDWYLAYYSGSNLWLAWIAADIVVLGIYIASYIYADIYFQQNQFEKLRTDRPVKIRKPRKRRRRRQRGRHVPEKETKGEETLEMERAIPRETKADLGSDDLWEDIDDAVHCDNMEENIRVSKLKYGGLRKKYRLGALPLTYVSWTFYAVVLVAKMLVIFLTFGEKLDVHALFGSNMLELAFAMTAAIFALVVSGHKKIPKKTHQKPVIKWMQHHVMLDMLDSVELMEYLYENSGDHHHKIEKPVQDGILAFVSIQMLVPSVGLYQLSATNFSHKDPPEYWSMVQQMMSTLFGNIPFLAIRIYLSTRDEITESSFIFIIKNVYGIITNTYEFIHWCGLIMASRKRGKTVIPPGVESSDSGSDSD